MEALRRTWWLEFDKAAVRLATAGWPIAISVLVTADLTWPSCPANRLMRGLTAGVLNKDYINSLKSKSLKEAAHQMNRRTDFKIISENLQDWLKENKQNDSPVQQGVLDENGNLIEIED